jgi:hypothetical protein
MSKRKSGQPQKISTPLVALILGGILLVATALFFVLGGGNDGGGTPRLVVDQEKIDYGDVHFGVSKTFTFKVTNTGDGLLRFKEKPYIQVLEGC